MLIRHGLPEFYPRCRGYVANLAVAVMPALLSRSEFACVTKLGDPARTRTCTFSAPRDEAFESLLVAIRNLGPWTGDREGKIDRLRLPYRMLLNEQKFVVIHALVSELENVTSVRALHPANTDCPECKGKGEVPQHGGLSRRPVPDAMAKDGSG